MARYEISQKNYSLHSLQIFINVLSQIQKNKAVNTIIGNKYVDFHCHSQSELTEAIEIVSVHPGQDKIGQFLTYGYHPWWSPTKLSAEQINTLRDHLSASNVVALGECGLDKHINTPFDIQLYNFECQIALANELNLPVIIHCVRQYEQILAVHQNSAKTQWVIHGYKRHGVLAKTILDAGIMLSLAPFDLMGQSYKDVLQMAPLDRIFIETDSDRRSTIEDRYTIFAREKQLDVLQLKQELFANCTQLFNSNWIDGQ